MKPKVSILVPIYNVSKYIVRCAESLFNQTFTDIEYIFVNDSTPDDSIEKLQSVLEKYPNRKSQVKIIHHTENKGLACARNTALDEADGEYIMVADSDDFLEINAVEVMYNAAIQENADIVVSDFYLEYPSDNQIEINCLPENDRDALMYLFLDKIRIGLWAKLIKSELYKCENCKVPDGLNYLEDRYVMIRLFHFAKKIIKVEGVFYHYVQYNLSAITKSKTEQHFKNTIQFWSETIQFLKNQNVYDLYSNILSQRKIKDKARLMIDVKSSVIRKKYADMFSEIPKYQVRHLKKGERLMLFLVDKRQFWLTNILREIFILKQKYRKKS